MKDTQIVVRLTQGERDAVLQIAKQQGKTISNVVRESFGLAPGNAPRDDQ